MPKYWESSVNAYFQNREYEFERDPYKYREHKRPKELKTVDQIRDELIAVWKIKQKRKRRKKS